ncbi:hypothetical protein [Actinophytocola sp.]|uniref:hypothetical protein n=1 Tax=Actinophytocola sp. TaxID=1872138 RepID=UPI002ED38180
MNEQDVRTLLDDLAHTPAPPSQVDVQHAVTTVKRRRRVQAVTSAAASVLVVGLAAGVTYSLIGQSPGNTNSPGSPATLTAAAPVTSAPQRFDPLVQYASYGWLPEQETLTWRSTSISGEQFTLNAQKYVPDPANGPNAALPAAFVGVQLYAAGVVPQTEKPFEVTTPAGKETMHYGPVTDAPAVNGAPAYWVGAPGDPETTILKWRYAPDAWAELFSARLSGDQRAVLHRIASELTVGGTERLRFPFQVTNLPADQRPTASAVEEGGPNWPWHASLDLDAGTDGQEPGLSVAVHPATDDSESRGPNTTVDNHPARRDTVEGDHLGRPEYSDRLHVFDVAGLQVNLIIDAKTAAGAAPLGPDGVLGVYRNVTVHPDRADWTDQPLR